jgi:hypothetical protein
VIDGGHLLKLQVLVKAAADGYVQELLAAADAQHRQVVLDAPAGQGQLERIALLVDLEVAGKRLFAIPGRRYVLSARQQQSVQPGIDPAQGCLD